MRALTLKDAPLPKYVRYIVTCFNFNGLTNSKVFVAQVDGELFGPVESKFFCILVWLEFKRKYSHEDKIAAMNSFK